MNAEPENEGGANRSQRPNNPLFNMRERLFHALFYRVALTYARAFPKPVRRILEFAILVKVQGSSIPYQILCVPIGVTFFFISCNIPFGRTLI